MTFSQRYGYTPAQKAIQLESMDDDLRHSLWNVVYTHLVGPLPYYVMWMGEQLTMMCRGLWTDLFKLPVDTLPEKPLPQVLKHLRASFFNTYWYEVFNVIEFVASADINGRRASRFRSQINSVFERESSGYRFVSEQIAPITDQLELGEIETALAVDSRAVSSQLEQALQYLSDRQSPDYRNSIKESISAVESEVRSTLGKEKGTLGQLLPELQKGLSLHPALTEAFSKLYGYTSDEGGIRHALMDDSRTVTFEEAKFMLVACSAFINYVRGARVL